MGRASFGPLAYALPGRPVGLALLVLWAVARVPSTFPAVRDLNLDVCLRRVNIKVDYCLIWRKKNSRQEGGKNGLPCKVFVYTICQTQTTRPRMMFS